MVRFPEKFANANWLTLMLLKLQWAACRFSPKSTFLTPQKNKTLFTVVALVNTMSDNLLTKIKELESEVARLKTELKKTDPVKVDFDQSSTKVNGGSKPNVTADKDGEEGGGTARKGKKRGQDRPFDFSVHPRRHVALRLAYLGWEYQGFAVQENTDNTVEARLFEAFLKTKLIQDRQSSNYHRCGRTDKGVSAFSQVGRLVSLVV